MTRTQYCREHIDKVAEECGLEKSVVSDVKRAAKFCAEHSDLSDCSTRSIIALIRIKDDPVRARAVSLAEKALNQATPTGGKKQTRLTEKEVRKLIQKAEMEVRGEFTKKYEQEREGKSAPTPGLGTTSRAEEKIPENRGTGAYCYQPGDLPPETDEPPRPPLCVTHKEILAEFIPPPQLPADAPESEKIQRDNLTLAQLTAERELAAVPIDPIKSKPVQPDLTDRERTAMNMLPVSTQALPRMNKGPRLPRADQDTATETWMKGCLSDRYRRIIQDAIAERNYETPLDAICAALDLLSESGGAD
jgi:hypothetical protein